VYEVALSVAGCLASGTRVDVAWLVDAEGLGPIDPAEALAVTPGGGRIGSLLSGALDAKVAALVGEGKSGRLVTVQVDEIDALIAGISAQGEARCLIVPATEIPPELWDALQARTPLCLCTELEGDRVTNMRFYPADSIASAGSAATELFSAATSAATVIDDAVITVLWPVPRLVIAGGGPIASALVIAAEPLGWRTQLVTEPREASGVIAGLAALDKVVVLGHDAELTGNALLAALAGPVGYIGALGAPHMQQARTEWLARRGITDLDRIHGPAGLPIGAANPAEIAVSIAAEAIAVASNKALTSA
jgi:xanthine dehydrogenase accessory factor